MNEFEDKFYGGQCADCSQKSGETMLAFQMTRAKVVVNQKRRWDRDNNRKETIQPYTYEKNGKAVPNPQFIKVYGQKKFNEFGKLQKDQNVVNALSKPVDQAI